MLCRNILKLQLSIIGVLLSLHASSQQFGQCVFPFKLAIFVKRKELFRFGIPFKHISRTNTYTYKIHIASVCNSNMHAYKWNLCSNTGRDWNTNMSSSSLIRVCNHKAYTRKLALSYMPSWQRLNFSPYWVLHILYIFFRSSCYQVWLFQFDIDYFVACHG